MNVLSIAIGVVIGVFIASNSPETADAIRHWSLVLLDAVKSAL
jgi:Na+/serine symporter